MLPGGESLLKAPISEGARFPHRHLSMQRRSSYCGRRGISCVIDSGHIISVILLNVIGSSPLPITISVPCRWKALLSFPFPSSSFFDGRHKTGPSFPHPFSSLLLLLTSLRVCVCVWCLCCHESSKPIIVAVDLQPMAPVEGVIQLQGDITRCVR